MSSLVDRLVAHQALASAPRAELEWLAAHGSLRSYAAGDVLGEEGTPIRELMVIFTGRGALYLERGSGRRKAFEWHSGEVSGALPFSRATNYPGRAMIEEDVEMLAVHRELFPELIRECPIVTAAMVHIMVDRARQFSATDWQDEKMMSLGRLAAGLAHELNNPASAAARSAQLLDAALIEFEAAAHALGAAGLTDSERAAVGELRERSLVPATTGVFSAMARLDREDALTDWFEEHGADLAVVAALTESGVTLDTLETLASSLSRPVLDIALRWVAAQYTAHTLATDVARATERISTLVSSVKRFTYMDRATVGEPASIAQGLIDTVAVLAAKARSKSVSVDLNLPADLPLVRIHGGELNQVWSNLLENALDAVADGGHVTISAKPEGTELVIHVVDNGSGIAPDIQARIFDPFFTTKPMGQGTGLGLDITRRIVRLHGGRIELDSRSGHTEFRVALPVVDGAEAQRPDAPTTRAV